MQVKLCLINFVSAEADNDILDCLLWGFRCDTVSIDTVSSGIYIICDMKKLFLILSVIAVTVSCSEVRDARSRLAHIETFINERPDSALVLLDSIDPSSINCRNIRAHHALLQAQAKDKCYIDETDDSQMLAVVEYYQHRRDKEKLFKAYYYLGRIQYNAGEYSEAMLSYTMAERLVDEVEDDFAKGLLYAQLGMLHLLYYDYSRSLEAYEEARSYYDKTDSMIHLHYTDLNIGYLYQEFQQYDTAENIYYEVMRWAYDNKQNSLCQEAVEFLITLYDETGNVDKGLALVHSEYASICSRSLHFVHTFAYELALQGDKQAYEIINNEAWNLSESLVDTLNTYYYKYMIDKLFGNYKDALDSYEQIYNLKDTLATISLRQPLLAAKNSYLQSENDQIKLKIQQNKTRISLVVICIIILLLILIRSVHTKIKKKNIEVIRYIEIAEELENTLITKRNEIEAISREKGAVDQELRKSSDYISDLLSKQYDLLNKLSGIYYETHVCRKDKDAIYKYVSTEIEKLGSDRNAISQLEDLVNRHKDNIMAVIRRELPDLTEMEYRLLCYLCAGFSAKAISVFTGDSTNNIYVKKSRLKRTIMNLDMSIRDIIMDAICPRQP